MLILHIHPHAQSGVPMGWALPEERTFVGSDATVFDPHPGMGKIVAPMARGNLP
jgi:hypothetical protein